MLSDKVLMIERARHGHQHPVGFTYVAFLQLMVFPHMYLACIH